MKRLTKVEDEQGRFACCNSKNVVYW